VCLDTWIWGHRRGLALLAAASALAVIACWAVIESAGAFPGDRAMRPWMGGHASWLEDHSVPGPLELAGAAVVALADPLPATVLTVAVALAAGRLFGRRYALVACAAASVVFASSALKAALGPSPLQSTTTPTPAGTLPSTHAAFAAAVLGLAVLMAVRLRRYPVVAILGLVIAAIGPLRVLEGAHWPSDVLAGYALGFAWLLVVLLVGARRPPPSPRVTPA
jgi:undecaprenyl-diphosphatase